jgi:hypothetical protein
MLKTKGNRVVADDSRSEIWWECRTVAATVPKMPLIGRGLKVGAKLLVWCYQKPQSPSCRIVKVLAFST